MTTLAMLPIQTWWGSSYDLAGVLAMILFVYSIYIMYDIFYGPMSEIPGPFWYKASGLPLAYMQARGKEAEMLPMIHDRYGPIVRIAPKEISFASGAEAWKDLYGFKKGGQAKPYKDPIMYSHVKDVTPFESINVANDYNHSRQRRVLAPAFSDTALRAQQSLLLGWAAKMKAKVAEKIPDGGCVKIDLLRVFQFTTFDLMGDLTFGEGLGMLDEGQYTPWVQTILSNIKMNAWMRVARHFKIGEVLANALMRTKSARAMHLAHFNHSKDHVDKRLARTTDRPDFWSFVLRKDEEQGGFSIGEQYSNASVFMIAGTETTATALGGAAFFLTQQQDILKRAQDEVRSAFVNLEDMTIDKLAGLKYLNACLQETLRLYPPLPVSLLRRTPAGGASVCGIWIPEDVTVGAHTYVTQTSPLHFKNPLEFHPERWLGDPEYANDHLNACAPFGVGPRNCLGQRLAWHEFRLLFATMLLHFDVSLAEESAGWNRQRLFTLWEKPPLICNVWQASAVDRKDDSSIAIDAGVGEVDGAALVDPEQTQ